MNIAYSEAFFLNQAAQLEADFTNPQEVKRVGLIA
jgi:hypothetical protein